MKPIWILDDEPGMRWVLERALDKAGWAVRCFADGAALLSALDDLDGPQDPGKPAVLVSDVRMPGLDGFGVLAQVRTRLPDLPVILMTAYTDLETTVAAFSQGAFDYLAKPFDIQAAIDLIVRAAGASSTSMAASASPQAPADVSAVPQDGPADPVRLEEGGMSPSRSPAMQEVFRAIGRLAQSSATVLITGESGTGKELVARALHQHSRRAAGPFVAVNAAAIPRDLLEAELFGHERGAFTGAVQMRRGRFEEADGGTLFLDEIGDMPAELQTRLLRVLAENSFYRVGGSRAVQVDVRIVAATHQPLEDRVQAGLFRADLFHRLNVIRLRLPALRARREDIESLARHFLARSAVQLGVPARTLEPSALHALQQFDYPGNIRQLENICQWLTVMTASPRVQAQDLPPEIRTGDSGGGVQSPGASPPDDWRTALAEEVRLRLQRQESDLTDVLRQDFERVLLRQALTQASGQRGRAALMLGIGRNTLTRKCQELGLDDLQEQQTDV
ncbi:nitrogen regulation protein NR(I) [Castellaniella sp.]|uniref:nitrogen regulation protein NR(I) n=1 Tax=Castellaniella sp. TaxID=1955812 RepID=UPI002AFDDC3F|nr:nitrogen regulation protein NR(I) [Castellaniella sp.]